MNKEVHYDFCPKCGALMRDGICQSCEFAVNVNDEYIDSRYNVPKANFEQSEKNRKTSLIIGLVIGGIALVLIIVVIFVIVVWSLFSNLSSLSPDEYWDEKDESYSHNYDYTEENSDEEEFLSFPDMTIEMPEVEGMDWDDIWDVTPEENVEIDVDDDNLGN